MEIKGITGAGVLLVALLGGMAGGALVAGGHDAAPPAVSFDQAAQTTAKKSPAQRAEAAAKRAEKAADRAVKAAAGAEASARKMQQSATPTPVPYSPWDERGAPAVPPGAQCWNNHETDPVAGQDGSTWYCVGGKYQSTKPVIPEPTPQLEP